LRKVALLACDDLSGYVVDDDLLVAPLKAAGWAAEFVSWSAPDADWSAYDAAIIRATWDYHYRLDAFLPVLREIEARGVPLFNPARVVEWNAHKRYLLELAEKGVPIVPTAVYNRIDAAALAGKFAAFDALEIVVKPMVSAGAFKTHRIAPEQLAGLEPQLRQELDGQDFMVQPFVERLLSEGEFSLFYFNNAFSHAIVKRPVKGDFRVQEEWGGIIEPVTASAEQRSLAEQVLAALPERCLYARVDMVQSSHGQWQVMEVELIEPSLYLRIDTRAPERFVQAFRQRWEGDSAS
jgi:glutathione synthase/RimK-type ligase-like ATP-grasp enzyme